MYTYLHVRSSTIPKDQGPVDAQVVSTHMTIVQPPVEGSPPHTAADALGGPLCLAACSRCVLLFTPGSSRRREGPGRGEVVAKGHTLHTEHMGYAHLWNAYKCGRGGLQEEGAGKQKPLKPALLETCQVRADPLWPSRKPTETCMMCCVRPWKRQGKQTNKKKIIKPGWTDG